MKKLFSFIVVAALATSFASCGSGDKAAAEKAAADSTRKAFVDDSTMQANAEAPAPNANDTNATETATTGH